MSIDSFGTLTSTGRNHASSTACRNHSCDHAFCQFLGKKKNEKELPDVKISLEHKYGGVVETKKVVVLVV